MLDFDVSLPRRPVRQPEPRVVSAGDCGACVLAGLLGVTVERAYDLHESDYYYRGPLDTTPAKEVPKRSPFGYHSMRRTLSSLHHSGSLDRYIEEQPVWLMGANVEVNGAFGPSAVLQGGAVRDYWLALFDAGYYGVAQVSMRGGGQAAGTDHWVMLCGARRRWEDRRGYDEVLVGDSATSMPHERWVEIHDFLRDHGGFMALFVRPAQ